MDERPGDGDRAGQEPSEVRGIVITPRLQCTMSPGECAGSHF